MASGLASRAEYHNETDVTVLFAAFGLLFLEASLLLSLPRSGVRSRYL